MVLSPQRHAQRPSSSSLLDLGLSLLKWIHSKVSTTFGNLFTQYAPQEIALPSAEGRSSQPPPTTIDKGKGRDPRPSLQALVLGDSNVNPGTTWNLNDIRSNFAHDLTGYVVQYGEHPFAYGSFGDVYRGTLCMSGRSIYVAVKAIRTYLNDDGDDAKKKKRFRREVRTWLNLDHINILPLFGTTMNFGQFPAMVSPWLENGALTSYLERLDGNLKTAERLALVGDVAAGLKYLHSRFIVHGDLSGKSEGQFLQHPARQRERYAGQLLSYSAHGCLMVN
ncbi:kinase-like protein [Paxillus ammoniavirescens]|nr:kinase-like protein [Paxillus ammoniavirescens]